MRRGIGLIRVSKDRDGLISPDLQRTAITTYAARSGIEITAWREALDESGSQSRSPWWLTLDEIIAEVEAGSFEVVVAWKFSRAARHRLKWAVALDRIETAGATLESATEGVDTSTSTGRFTRGMLAELAAFEAERIGDVWKEVKARRVRLGLTGDGQPRFGYDLVDGQYVPNEWADTLRSCYEQRASGVPMRQLARWMNSQGATTRTGMPWDDTNLRKMLATGFAAGLLNTQNGYLPGAHEPVISAALWEQVKAIPVNPAIRSSSRHELSGLLRCGHCHHTLYPVTKAGVPPGTAWRCDLKYRLQGCPGTYAWAPAARKILNKWVEGLLDGTDRDYMEAVAQLAAKPTRAAKSQTVRLLKVENELVTLGEKNLRGFYDDDTYLRLRAGLVDEQRLLRKLTTQPDAVAVPSRSALEALMGLEGEARNGAWRQVLSHVTVRTREQPKYEPLPLWVVSR